MKKTREQIRLGYEPETGRQISQRRSGDKLSHGVYGPVQDGKPLPPGAELIEVSGDPDEEGWRDVKVVYKNTSGPAQVATPAYREGYDRIFGKQKVGQA